MSKPWVHAESSARKYGGKPEDYLEIHNFMDSSKTACADGRHRYLTHNTWFLSTVLERVFGVTLTNSDGRVLSVRTIGEDHVLEDYGNRFIPTAQDFIEAMNHEDWMLNGKGVPPSSVRLQPKLGPARDVIVWPDEPALPRQPGNSPWRDLPGDDLSTQLVD